MNNLLPRSVRMHQKYDLKGSTYKRRASQKEREKVFPTYKDLDFVQDVPDGLFLDTDMHSALCKTLQRDCLVGGAAGLGVPGWHDRVGEMGPFCPGEGSVSSLFGGWGLPKAIKALAEKQRKGNTRNEGIHLYESGVSQGALEMGQAGWAGFKGRELFGGGAGPP